MSFRQHVVDQGHMRFGRAFGIAQMSSQVGSNHLDCNDDDCNDDRIWHSSVLPPSLSGPEMRGITDIDGRT